MGGGRAVRPDRPPTHLHGRIRSANRGQCRDPQERPIMPRPMHSAGRHGTVTPSFSAVNDRGRQGCRRRRAPVDEVRSSGAGGSAATRSYLRVDHSDVADAVPPHSPCVSRPTGTTDDVTPFEDVTRRQAWLCIAGRFRSAAGTAAGSFMDLRRIPAGCSADDAERDSAGVAPMGVGGFFSAIGISLRPSGYAVLISPAGHVLCALQRPARPAGSPPGRRGWHHGTMNAVRPVRAAP